MEQLWRPQVGFINTDDIQQTQVDEDAVTTVYRKDTQFTPDLASPYEGMFTHPLTHSLSTCYSLQVHSLFFLSLFLLVHPLSLFIFFFYLPLINSFPHPLVFTLIHSLFISLHSFFPSLTLSFIRYPHS